MIESIACPTCRRRLPLRADLLGQRVRCPICEVSFIAGAPTAVTSPAPAETHPPAPSVRSADPPGAPQPLLWPYASAPPAPHAPAAPRSSPAPQMEEVIVEVEAEAEADDQAAGYREPFLRREPYDIFETSAGDDEPQTALLPPGEHFDAPAPPPGRRRHAREARGNPVPLSPPREWSEARTAAFRTGLGMILFGIGSLVLPQLGYQFEKINKLGDSAPIAGVAVGFFGLLVTVVCLLPRRARVGLRVSLVVLFAISGLLLAAVLTLPQLLTP